jgi:hypothetical protein
MTDSARGALLVVRLEPAHLTALDAAAAVFNCTRAELARHVLQIFCAGVAAIGTPPEGSRLEDLAFRGQWVPE